MNLDLESVVSFIRKISIEVECLEKGLKSGKYNFEQEKETFLIVQNLKKDVEKAVNCLRKLT